MNKALYIRKLEEARAQLAAAVRMNDEAGQFMPQMSPALRVATRGGIDRVINARQATVTRLALMLERAG